VFGSDYPYLRRDLAVSCRQRIQDSPELTGSERTAILGGTAATLIPRLAALRPKGPVPRPNSSKGAPALYLPLGSQLALI
jgi:hypothetical protein